MAAVKLVGGNSCARQEDAERAREGERPRGEWDEREGDVGVAWRPLGVSRRRQKQEVAGAWPARGEHASRVLLARGGRRLAAPAGWAEPGGWASTGKAQVASLSIFFSNLFLFFYLTATVGL